MATIAFKVVIEFDTDCADEMDVETMFGDYVRQLEDSPTDTCGIESVNIKTLENE